MIVKKKHIGHTFEFAFKVGKTHFYKFKDESEFMKFPRWEAVSKHREMYSLRFTPENFDKFLTAMETNLNDGQLGMMGALIQEARARQQHLTQTEAMYQFAAQYFMRLGENVSKASTPAEMNEKIELFKKKPLLEFIYIEPIPSTMLLPELLEHFSKDALLKRMRQETAIRSGLNLLLKG